MGLLDLPGKVQQQLGSNPAGSLVVKRFIIGDFRVIRPGRVDHLAENRVDQFRAAVSEEIGAAYDVALAIQNGDI